MTTETKSVHFAIFCDNAIHGIGSGVDSDAAREAALDDAANWLREASIEFDREDVDTIRSIRGEIDGFAAAKCTARLVEYVNDLGGCGFAFDFNDDGLLDIED